MVKLYLTYNIKSGNLSHFNNFRASMESLCELPTDEDYSSTTTPGTSGAPTPGTSAVPTPGPSAAPTPGPPAAGPTPVPPALIVLPDVPHGANDIGAQGMHIYA